MRIFYYLQVAFKLLKNCKISSLGNLIYENKYLNYKIHFTSLHDLLAIKEVIFDNDYLRDYSLHADKNNKSLVVVDIGAGVGDFCVKANLDYPKVRIWAFEPNAASFRALNENIKINNIPATLFNSKVIKLSDVFKFVDKIDILKIDCEGEEFSILHDQTKYLNKVKFITGEYHEHAGNKSDLVKLLEAADFKVILHNQRSVPGLGLFTASRV